MHNTSNVYNTTCLKTALDSKNSPILDEFLDNSNNYTRENWEIDEKFITKCAIGGHIGDQVEEGIPYVAGNTLWAVYQVY